MLNLSNKHIDAWSPFHEAVAKQKAAPKRPQKKQAPHESSQTGEIVPLQNKYT